MTVQHTITRHDVMANLLKLTQHHWCTALLEELETLVEQLDQQEAAKQQALRQAEAAERELEALKAETPQMAAVSAVLRVSVMLGHHAAAWSGLPTMPFNGVSAVQVASSESQLYAVISLCIVHKCTWSCMQEIRRKMTVQAVGSHAGCKQCALPLHWCFTADAASRPCVCLVITSPSVRPAMYFHDKGSSALLQISCSLAPD